MRSQSASGQPGIGFLFKRQLNVSFAVYEHQGTFGALMGALAASDAEVRCDVCCLVHCPDGAGWTVLFTCPAAHAQLGIRHNGQIVTFKLDGQNSTIVRTKNATLAISVVQWKNGMS